MVEEQSDRPDVIILLYWSKPLENEGSEKKKKTTKKKTTAFHDVRGRWYEVGAQKSQSLQANENP